MTFPSSRLMAVLLIAFCLTSCVEVTFPEPMPVNRKELDSFPKSWQGTWTSNEKGTDDADDEDILVIQADRVSGLEGSEDVLTEVAYLQKIIECGRLARVKAKSINDKLGNNKFPINSTFPNSISHTIHNNTKCILYFSNRECHINNKECHINNRECHINNSRQTTKQRLT